MDNTYVDCNNCIYRHSEDVCARCECGELFEDQTQEGLTFESTDDFAFPNYDDDVYDDY